MEKTQSSLYHFILHTSILNCKIIFYPKVIFEQHTSFKTNQHAIKQRAIQHLTAFLAIKEGKHLTDAVFYSRFIYLFILNKNHKLIAC